MSGNDTVSKNMHHETEAIEPVDSIASLILELPPSCLEFWPLARDVLVVGTYSLDDPGKVKETIDGTISVEEQGQKRSGSLILLKVNETAMCVHVLFIITLAETYWLFSLTPSHIYSSSFLTRATTV